MGRGKLDKKSGMVTWEGLEFRYRPGSTIKEERETLDADAAARVEGRSFTISRPGGTLRGTFVAPESPELEFGVRSRWTVGYKQSISKAISRAVFAEAGPGADFFCVMTIQRGEPPEVKVTGSGLSAVVRVGDRTVRFDGRGIVFGE